MLRMTSGSFIIAVSLIVRLRTDYIYFNFRTVTHYANQFTPLTGGISGSLILSFRLGIFLP